MYKNALATYIIGFIISIGLTLAAFFAVLRPGFFNLGSETVVVTILNLAILQLIVQMFFFLHIGKEHGPRWNLGVFISTLSLVLVIVVGSLWIMNNLNYSMTGSDMDTYMHSQENIQSTSHY